MYTIKGIGGANVQISLGDDVVGHVRAGIGPKKVDEQLVAGVETINVTALYQKRGLGLLLAMAFYVRSQKGNAGFVELSTTDTSGGWWGSLGMGENTPVSVEAAISKINFPIKVRW